jgi:hypothetical protein
MFTALRDSVRARVLIISLALLSGLFLTSRLHAAPSQTGANKTVFVAAVDAADKPVAGLAKDGWALREDGNDRTIVDVKPAADPLDVVLLIDTSINSQPSVTELRNGLQAFAQTLFAGSAPVNMSVMDVAAADVMVAENKKTLDDVSKVLGKTYPDRAGNTVMIEGMNDAAKKLAKSPTPRRAMVLVNLDRVPEASSSDLQKVINAIIASNASVWAVTYENTATKGITGGGGTSGSDSAASGSNAGMVGSGNIGQNLELMLSKAPGGTGGLRTHLSVATGLTDRLTELAKTLVGQYAVTYERPGGGTPHVVEVGQTRADVTVLYATTPIK